MKSETNILVDKYINELPLMKSIINCDEVLWNNSKYKNSEESLKNKKLNWTNIMDASDRLDRFKPLLVHLFPETKNKEGIIESELTEIDNMNNQLVNEFGKMNGRLMLKEDSNLPIAGSVKARGGIYEILKFAESLALENKILTINDNYIKLSEMESKELFKTYEVIVGSTGNLGLSIGIISAKLGFSVTVHMSADAKKWKKELLRSNGVKVVEHNSDYSKAVEEGRLQAEKNPRAHFVDDENSLDLFLGYSVAAIRLEKQLIEMGVVYNEEIPLILHIPCGVGGAPGGIAFGLKHVFKEKIRIYFVEPTHSPSMLIGLMTGEHDELSVQDFGIDNLTEADGLACGRPSKLAGPIVEDIINGIYTIEDKKLFNFMQILYKSEGIFIEPSAAAGFLGTIILKDIREGSTQIVWATGGRLVPDDIRKNYLQY